MAEIAIIGSGIAGLGCAWWLTECGHNVTVYAGGSHVGGHAHTVLANPQDGPQAAVDLGTCAYHEAASPNLARLYQQLGVATQPSDLSLAVSLYEGDLEYSPSSLRGWLAQPGQLFSGQYWAMVRDVRRFNANAQQILTATNNPSVLEYMQVNHYSDAFVSRYLVPLASALWFIAPADIMQFPIKTLVRCFEALGLLGQKSKGEWRAITGGSTSAVTRLCEKFAARILGTPATRIKRTAAGPLVESAAGFKPYDAVVMACHADEALTLLTDPSEAERELLGAFRFSSLTAVLHQDDSLMPARGAAWASRVFLTHPEGKAAVSCWMNNLQDIDDSTPFFVTLNPPRAPAPAQTLTEITFTTPALDTTASTAQHYLGHLQGEGGLWYCGAWTGDGFQEDALTSGLRVAEMISGQARPWQVTEISPAASNVAARPTVLEVAA